MVSFSRRTYDSYRPTYSKRRSEFEPDDLDRPPKDTKRPRLTPPSPPPRASFNNKRHREPEDDETNGGPRDTKRPRYTPNPPPNRPYSRARRGVTSYQARHWDNRSYRQESRETGSLQERYPETRNRSADSINALRGDSPPASTPHTTPAVLRQSPMQAGSPDPPSPSGGSNTPVQEQRGPSPTSLDGGNYQVFLLSPEYTPTTPQHLLGIETPYTGQSPEYGRITPENLLGGEYTGWSPEYGPTTPQHLMVRYTPAAPASEPDSFEDFDYWVRWDEAAMYQLVDMRLFFLPEVPEYLIPLQILLMPSPPAGPVIDPRLFELPDVPTSVPVRREVSWSLVRSRH